MTIEVAVFHPPIGDGINNIYPGEDTPLPSIGNRVKIIAMDGSGWEKLGVVSGVNQKRHVYNVVLIEKSQPIKES